MLNKEKRIIDATVEEFKVEILEVLKEELADVVNKLKPKPQTVWLNRKEVADKLGVTYQTLHNWNVSGKLRSHKLGGIVRYKLSDVESLTN